MIRRTIGLLVALAAGCGGAPASSTTSGTTEASAPDLGTMAWNDATETALPALCDRVAAISGPERERTCPDGRHDRRGVDAASCGAGERAPHMPDLPQSCTVTVAEVEECLRALAEVPECDAPARVRAALGGACAAMTGCVRAAAHDVVGDEPPR